MDLICEQFDWQQNTFRAGTASNSKLIIRQKIQFFAIVFANIVNCQQLQREFRRTKCERSHRTFKMISLNDSLAKRQCEILCTLISFSVVCCQCCNIPSRNKLNYKSSLLSCCSNVFQVTSFGFLLCLRLLLVAFVANESSYAHTKRHTTHNCYMKQNKKYMQTRISIDERKFNLLHFIFDLFAQKKRAQTFRFGLR